MRTLWEAIQDNDTKVDAIYEESRLLQEITDELKKHFSNYLENDSKIKKVGSWCPLGRVDDDLYNKESIKDTEDFMIKTIKQMHRDIKKTLKKTLADVETSVDNFGENHIKYYNLTLYISGCETKHLIQFVLHSKRNKFGEEVEYIAIWTKDTELADLI